LRNPGIELSLLPLRASRCIRALRAAGKKQVSILAWFVTNPLCRVSGLFISINNVRRSSGPVPCSVGGSKFASFAKAVSARRKFEVPGWWSPAGNSPGSQESELMALPGRFLVQQPFLKRFGHKVRAGSKAIATRRKQILAPSNRKSFGERFSARKNHRFSSHSTASITQFENLASALGMAVFSNKPTPTQK